MARADPLKTYRDKRRFDVTSEPSGGGEPAGARLVVQHHLARRDHYDLRLEIDGVLASWAVTRGPSARPRDKRLAVRTEDHPLSYGAFEGEIPKGEYGGGRVILWEYATYSPLNGDPAQALAKGDIKFEAHGTRMRGGWALVRMKGEEKRENWLLIKERDAFAEADDSLTARFPDSVNADAPRRRKAAPPPDFQKLQLCESAEATPEGPQWLYEIKYDGYRLALAVGSESARVFTRSGLDWTAKFPALAGAARGLKCRSALIDGEAVVFDKQGVSDFPGLVAALERGETGAVVYLAFDLLALDGKDLRSRPLEARKAALRTLVGDDGPIRYAGHVEGEGAKVFAGAVAAGAEGIVAKDRRAAYAGRRSGAFVKVKGYPRTDVLIVGFKPSERMSTFASLHAAVEENGEWRYVGGIGTGFSDRQRADLQARFASGASKTRPARLKGDVPPRLMFVKRPARAEIRFGGWTGSGHLRQARFLALREDLPMAPALKPPALTHAERVVYPDCGITKGEIAAYYAAVAERLAPHLEGRPLSLVRAPETIAETFFQRHPLKGMSAGVAPVEIGAQTYMTLAGAAGLATAAQFGAVELHGWMARVGALDAPDRVVFDLDPDPALPFAEVVRAAQDLARALEDLGLRTFPLLTGGKGVHLIAPLDGAAPFAQTEAFAKGFAQALAAHDPQRFVAKMGPARRKGRIFVDWLRNKATATSVLPWSLRARPGAPVATPVSWVELKRVKSGAAFDIHSAPKRKDPWRGFFDLRQRTPRTGG